MHGAFTGDRLEVLEADDGAFAFLAEKLPVEDLTAAAIAGGGGAAADRRRRALFKRCPLILVAANAEPMVRVNSWTC